MRKAFLLNALIIVSLTLAAAPLRYANLSYSEYQDDEKKAFFRMAPTENVFEFLVRQRKGPMQFLVSYIPFTLTGNFRNELAERLPFATINLASVLVFYLLIRKITRDRLAALLGSLLYATNGFVVAFSRIVQYQNLNLFFSLLALYFYADVIAKDRRLIRSTLLGTVFFCLSLLSHWDAVFYLIPILYFFVRFLKRTDITPNQKRTLILTNFALGSVLLLPFLIPYIKYHLANTGSANYLAKRVGFNTVNLERHRFIFDLYNPFITLPVYIGLACLSLAAARKHLVYILWPVVNFLTILFFMVKPGTHIYNYVVPFIFLFAVTTSVVLAKASTKLKAVLTLIGLTLFGTFFFQSYMLFVDHTSEYPWEAKTIFGKTTKPYVDKEVLTFGFPHFRDWKGVNNFVLSYNNQCGYITNEGKEISQIYMDLDYGNIKGCYYVISIKKPFISTRDGAVFANTKKKIYQYEARGMSLTKVYVKGI